MRSRAQPGGQLRSESNSVLAAATTFFLACAALFGVMPASAQAPEEAPAPVAAPDNTRSPPSIGRKAPPPATIAVVDQPRGTGYFVGDKVIQRVLLETNGKTLTPAMLPKAGRASAWFERRAVNIQTDASRRRWLVVEYQILNAPPKLITARLPSWSLPIKGDAGAAPAALTVPEARVNVAPLSLPGSPAQVGTADLRPDHLPPLVETAPLRRAIETSVGSLLLTLIAWFVWIIWRNHRAQATQPFANALREMRAMDDREPRAWQALHRAFDRTAGRVIQSATLPVLFERAPQLIPVRGQIEQFFAHSSQLFFGSAPATSIPESTRASAPSPRSASGPSPRALCVELRSIEKRHER